MRRIAVLALALVLGGCALPQPPPAPARAATPAGPAFEIRAFAVEGNTLLEGARIDALLAPWAGRERQMADVLAAAGALQDAYRRAGYGAVTVSVPEQQLQDGRVHLAVQEPRVRDLTVQGAVHETEEHVLGSLPALRAGTTPNSDELARELRLANENPARRLSVDLRSPTPGTIDALVGVQDDKPWKVGATLDNTGTASTGRLRAGGFVQHANVADLDHVATLQYVMAPEEPGQVHIAALNYRAPLPALGDALDAYAIYADVDSGVIGALQVRGRGTVVGARYNRYLAPLVEWQQRAWLGLEARELHNRVGPPGGALDLVPDVTLHPLSLGYVGGWSGAGTQLDASATVLRNIPGGDKGGAADIAAARTGASARYTVLRYAAGWLQTLRADTPLRVAIDGQWTRDALVAAEQFGLGGAESVRGFDERELIGDRGLRTTLELQTPNVGPRIEPRLAARGLVFLDQGWIHRNLGLPGEAVTANVASVGVGARMLLPPSWQGRADFAYVLQGGGVHARGDQRLHVSVGYAY
jgi:hemolysin activation/secretion protein